MRIDQREMGLEFEKDNLNWTDRFKKTSGVDFVQGKSNYNFKNIKSFPESRKDVLFPDIHQFNHRMDALKYCSEKQIPFLWWNDQMYDLEGNVIDFKYYSLPLYNE